MKFKNILRGKLAERETSLSEFARSIGQSPQNFIKKLNNGNITYDVAVELAEKIGYEIKWIEKRY